MTKDFDIEKYKADQARARDLGFDYAELSSIINSAHNDGDDGISMGRAIEMIREIGLRAVDKAVAQEREDVVAWLKRMRDNSWHWHGKENNERADIYVGLVDVFECGEHNRKENT